MFLRHKRIFMICSNAFTVDVMHLTSGLNPQGNVPREVNEQAQR